VNTHQKLFVARNPAVGDKIKGYIPYEKNALHFSRKRNLKEHRRNTIILK